LLIKNNFMSPLNFPDQHPSSSFSSSAGSSRSSISEDAYTKQFKEIRKESEEKDEKIRGLKKEQKRQLTLIWGALIALIITAIFSIIGISKDVYLDVDRYDSLQNQINELDRNHLNFYKEFLEKESISQSISNCLKLKNNKYWEYPECFK